MDKFLNYLKENKLFVGIVTTTVLALVLIITVSLKDTYSLGDKYVVFEGIDSYRGRIIKSCKINSNGKLDTACVNEAKKVCSSYTAHYWDNDVVDLTGTFNDDTTVYCLGDSSSPTGYTWGCYVCPDDPTVMKWLIYGGGYAMPDLMRQDENCPGKLLVKDESITDDKQCQYTPPENACYECKADSTILEWRDSATGDNKCPGGYKKTTKTEAQCQYTPPENACYECKADSTILEWRDSATGDNKCPGGYKKTTKTEAQCQYTPPENACYECKADSTILEWRDSATGDNKCPGGYRKLDGVTKANCNYVAPPSSSKPTYACYECKADKNIMQWRTSALGDNKCPGGYNKTTKTKAECNVDIPVNPPTGQTRYIITIIMASIAIGCSLWYLKRSV